jgi:hypothetical protein
MPESEVLVSIYHSGDEPHPQGVTVDGSGVLEDGTYVDIYAYVAPGQKHGKWTYEYLKQREGGLFRILDDGVLEEIPRRNPKGT